MQRRRVPVFVLLSNAEFDKLSTERKAAYLATAVQAWKTGTPIATPNGEFDEEGSLD
jgi:hypothetical protein